MLLYFAKTSSPAVAAETRGNAILKTIIYNYFYRNRNNIFKVSFHRTSKKTKKKVSIALRFSSFISPKVIQISWLLILLKQGYFSNKQIKQKQ